MITHERVSRAVFCAEGQPDTEVRVMDDGTFSIMFSPEVGLVFAGWASEPFTQKLQLAEATQFISDVLSASIPGRMTPFVRGWNNTASDIHQTAKDKGFWEDGVDRNNGEMLCLVHSEISEALEALRKGNPPDDKIPEFSGVETELADAVIRIMDLGHARGWRVAEAIEAKMKFNSGRPYKHGKEF